MRRLGSKWKDLGYLAYRWMEPVFNPVRAARAIPGYARFVRDWGTVPADGRGGADEADRTLIPLVDDATGPAATPALFSSRPLGIPENPRKRRGGTTWT